MDFTSLFSPAFIAEIRQHLFVARTFDDDAARKTGLMYGIVSIGIFFLSLLGSIAFMQGGMVLAVLDFLVALILFGILFFTDQGISGSLYLHRHRSHVLPVSLYFY